MEELRHFPLALVYGLLAVAGGIARYSTGIVNGQKFKLSIFVASIFAAGFSGYIFALVGDFLHMPPPASYIMAGLGGYFGDQTMKLILELIEKKLK